ncbi:MAG: ATP-binding protein [Acidimicrobiia bacterium]|nr:ATP-binding protein [Acidimicrobiia bacterium]
MEARAEIFSDDVLLPVFRARLILYWIGTAIAIVLVAVGAPWVLLPVVTVGAVAATWQRQRQAVLTSWLLDTGLALVIAAAQDSPLGLAMIVAWSGLLGLVGVRRRWLVAAVNSAAGGVAAALLEPAESVFSVGGVVRSTAAVMVVLFVFVMFRNVGELVRHGERELRAFFERVPVALTRSTVDGRLLEFNKATGVMFEDATVGESVVERLIDIAGRQEFVDTLERDGVVGHHEATVRVSPSKTIEAVIAANAVTGEEGELRYIETAVLDATPMRNLEAERELLARVIDSANDLVALANWDGSVRYVNPAAREWTRKYVTADEPVHATQVFSGDDFIAVMGVLSQVGEWSGTLNVDCREGQRTINATFHVLEMAGRTTIAGVGHDITDEVETQRKLKDLIKAKDELVASISHEIRTPLSVVLGLSSELRDSSGEFDAKTANEFAALIAEQGQEMAHIVEDLLVAARADGGSIVLDPAQVDLAQEVESTLRSIAATDLPDHIDIDVNGTCWGDPTRIRQILRNLIVNAHRHGGDRVRLASRSAGSWVSLDVADNGPGVPADSADSIFEPFSRGLGEESQPASIGLGLSVSRDLASRMGGDLTYERRSGETVFTLTLPESRNGDS